MSVLSELTIHLGALSPVAFGGAGAILPEMHRLAVEQKQWINNTTFSHLVAISQAAPGPNMTIATLVGWQVAGIKGALAATVAISVPSGVLIAIFIRFWEKMRGTRLRLIIQAGVAPLAIGLVLASGFIVSQGATPKTGAYLLTAITALVVMKSKLHPLWLIAAGAMIGLSGLI